MRSIVRNQGFTIVELLIVIVIIAILASVSIAAYSGAQQRAYNTSSSELLHRWEKSFEQYRALTGSLPALTDNTGYCLGINFPNGKCRAYQTTGTNTYNEADNSGLLAAFASQNISTPTTPSSPIGAQVAPYVLAYPTRYELFTLLYGSDGTVCTNNGMTAGYNASSYQFCYLILRK